jgi:hypothetical protein
MAQETRHDLQSLVDSQGWKYVKMWLENQLEMRRRDSQKPAESMDGMVQKEYIVGEISGLILAISTPMVLLSGVSDEMETLKLEIEETKNENTPEQD